MTTKKTNKGFPLECHLSTCKRVSLITVFLLPILCFAQLETTSDSSESKEESTLASLNLEIPPASPVFVLLGIEPTSIERPGTPTDFAVSILKATDNLSVLPRDYAIEIAPFWLCKNSTTYDQYWSSSSENEFWRTFRNTATVSLATVSKPDTTLDSFVTSLGAGLRFSIAQSEIIYKDTLDALSEELTGKVWLREEEFFDTLESITDSMNNVSDSLRFIKDSLRAFGDTSESLKTELEDIKASLESLLSSLDSIGKTWDDSLHNLRIREYELLGRIDDIVEKKRLIRKGGQLDFAGAGVFDFPQGEFENGTFNRVGIWFTGGWEWSEPNIGLVGTLRGFYGNLETAKLSGDLGARLIWDPLDEFSLSFEITGRGFVDPSDGENYHLRWDLIAEYAVTKNNLLSFTFGKDYTKGIFEGELIASINFKQGFGSMRPVLALTD